MVKDGTSEISDIPCAVLRPVRSLHLLVIGVSPSGLLPITITADGVHVNVRLSHVYGSN